MSGADSLTEGRIQAKLRVLLRDTETLYAKSPQPPDSPFWMKLDAIDAQIGRAIQKRPLGNMDIERMFASFKQKIIALF